MLFKLQGALHISYQGSCMCIEKILSHGEIVNVCVLQPHSLSILPSLLLVHLLTGKGMQAKKLTQGLDHEAKKNARSVLDVSVWL